MPRRPTGWTLFNQALWSLFVFASPTKRSTIGVSIAPNATAFTRTPCFATSNAAERVKPLTACLDDGVNAITRQANLSDHRRRVHNRAAFFQDCGDFVLHAEQRPKHVDIENLPVILLGLLLRRQIQRAFDTGIIEREIKPSKGLNRLVHEGFDIGLPADICLNKQGFATSFSMASTTSRPSLSRRPSNNHFGSCCGQRQARGFLQYQKFHPSQAPLYLSNEVFMRCLSLLYFSSFFVTGLVPLTLLPSHNFLNRVNRMICL